MQSKVPSYRLHRGSGQAIVTINRRDYYLGQHNTPDSRKRYNRLIAEYLSSPETFLLSNSKKPDTAVSELIVAFLAFVKSEVGDKEYKGIKLAMKPLRKLYGDTSAKDFGTSQYKAVRAVFVREIHPVRKKPRTRQYVNRAMVYVSRLFKWAASEQLIPAGVYETLRLIPGLKKGKTEAPESKRVRPISISDVEKTLIHCLPIVATMIQVQLLVGCRPGEVCSLTPAMIDRTEEVWQANRDKHKTSHHEKERTLYFGPKAQKLISPFLNREPDRNLFSPREAVEQRNAQLVAVRGPTPWFKVVKSGTNVVDPKTGINKWNADADRGHAYLIMNAPKSQVETALEDLQTAGRGRPTKLKFNNTYYANAGMCRITARGEAEPSMAAVKAFDSDERSVWLDQAKLSWMQCQYIDGRRYCATSYTVVCPDRERLPASLKLSGSNDGTNWTELDVQEAPVFSERISRHEFALANAAKWNRYRLDVTSINEKEGVRIATIELNEVINCQPEVAVVSVTLDAAELSSRNRLARLRCQATFGSFGREMLLKYLRPRTAKTGGSLSCLTQPSSLPGVGSDSSFARAIHLPLRRLCTIP